MHTTAIRKLLFAVCMLAASWASAAEFSVGAATAVRVSPYKSYDTLVKPLPFITYDGDRAFVKGAQAGAYLLKSEHNHLYLSVSWLGLEFKHTKTDNRALRRLDRRKTTMNADLGYSFVSKFGLVRASVSQDVLGRSDGQLANLSLHVPWMTDYLVIMPGLGVEWASAKHNRYYYGISRSEARKSGLSRYNPGATVSPYATLEAKFKINNCWDVVAKGRLDYIHGRIQDSSMIGKRFAATVTAGVQYSF